MVIFGFGNLAGAPILGWVNDKLGGDRMVAKTNMWLHLFIYASILLCNELHTYNFFCYFSAFFMGTSDTAILTQISITVVKYFHRVSAQLYALFNVIKMLFMSLILLLGGMMPLTQGAFRWFFLGIGIANVMGQAIMLATFRFEVDANEGGDALMQEMEDGPKRRERNVE